MGLELYFIKNPRLMFFKYIQIFDHDALVSLYDQSISYPYTDHESIPGVHIRPTSSRARHPFRTASVISSSKFARATFRCPL